MEYLVGIDLGTSSVKTLIMDVHGTVMSIQSKRYAINNPKQGYAEQDPEAWWDATVYTVNKAIMESGVNPAAIKGIGFSGQMHGLVALDKHGKLIRPAIIHLDQRTSNIVEEIYDKVGREEINKTTLNPIFPGFQIISLLWLKENDYANYQKIYKVVSPKDYIRYRLVGEIGTETTDASATLAFDNVNRCWSRSIISKLGLDISYFAECKEPYAVAGYITEEAAQITGLKKGTTVVFGGGDQPMQALGNGIIKPGIATSTIGTSGIIYTPLHEPLYNPALNTHTFCNVTSDRWYIMGAILTAGLSLRWLQEKILSNEDFDEMTEKASTVPAGSNGLFFLPYLVGERTPHLDSNARGVYFGLSFNHDRSNIIRSTMEGVTYALKDSFTIFDQLGITIDKVVASGGGARSKLWLQMQADIFDREIYTTNIIEQACTGAAMVAGIGCGIYSNVEEACANVTKINNNPTIPIENNVNKYKEYYEIYVELYKANKDLFEKISNYT